MPILERCLAVLQNFVNAELFVQSFGTLTFRSLFLSMTLHLNAICFDMNVTECVTYTQVEFAIRSANYTCIPAWVVLNTGSLSRPCFRSACVLNVRERL